MESTATTGVESPPVQSKRLARFCARGVSFGILAYLVGYLLVAALFVFGPANIDQTTHLDIQLKWFGFVFYNAQFVPIAVAGQSYNYITQAADPAVPPLVYQAIPILALGVASVVFAVRSRLEGFVQTVVYSGASVAVGYAVLAIMGALLFSISSSGITAQPELLKAAVFGAAYPIVIATVVTGIVAFVHR
ncbi:hypothetical protein NKF26_16015 [Haladaptatus sp. AB618]|uniref:hypothetical protein n=1 Tax=Haladaptatus sp. AB618 TaxID=2934173 RepID=UPI00209C0D18|nr:hypothetical protein [Haladaptatus sp. AB618]MCO8255312.1 hypothetical protein [Haladaptatus sp. AB618]